MSTDGKTPVCLVTGASGGIGQMIATRAAGAGFHVILTGRDPERTALAGRAAATAGSAETVVADLSDQAGVRKLADRVLDRHQRLDVLVNNAGMIRSGRALSPDGVELTWAVNYLAPFLLTYLLLDRLEAAPRARVVNVTSAVQGFGELDFGDLQFERRPYRAMAAYSQSKLALVMFTVELAARVAESGIEVNAVHPGGARTGLARDLDSRDLNLLSRAIDPLMSVLNSSTERAAAAPAHLAITGAGTTGKYFGGYLLNRMPPRPGRANPLTKDPAARRRLWEISLDMTDLA